MLARGCKGRISLALRSLVGLAALAGCTAPEYVSTGPAVSHFVVSTRGGEALAAWDDNHHILVSSFLAGGSAWTTPKVIVADVAPEAAVSTSGRAFLLYSGLLEGIGLQAMVRENGVWGPPTAMVATNGDSSAVAADGMGNAIAVYVNEHYDNVQARLYRSAQGWQAATTLQPCVVGRVAVALNEAGQGVAAWCSNDPGYLTAMHYDPATGWGSAYTTNHECCDYSGPPVAAIAENGRAFVVSASGRVCAIQGVTGWAADVLNAQGQSEEARVSAAPDGHALVAWRQPLGGVNHVRLRAYVPGTGWGTTIDGPAADAHDVAYGGGTGDVAGAAVTYLHNGSLSFVTYSTAQGTLGSPIDVALPSTHPAHDLLSATDPTAGNRGFTLISDQIFGEALLATRYNF